MSNTFVNTSWVSREALELVQPNMLLARSINTDYSSEFGKEGMKVGSTINVPLPQSFVGRTGSAVSIENLSNLNTPVTLNVQYGEIYAACS
jgi:hypothetical protein